jgi:hypothetical protein
MPNNDQIFNAVLSGAGGATQERWITELVAADYTEFVDRVVAIATAVDSNIAPGTIDLGERSLMQAIAQGVFSGRFPHVTTYEQIADAITILYDVLAAELFPEAGGGGGTTDTTVNNSNVPGATCSDALDYLLANNTSLESAGTVLGDASVTIATITRQVMLAATLATVNRTLTITPSADAGIAFPIEIGTQAAGLNVIVLNGGPAGGSTQVTAGTKRVVWVLSDGLNVTFSKSPLANEPALS